MTTAEWRESFRRKMDGRTAGLKDQSNPVISDELAMKEKLHSRWRRYLFGGQSGQYNVSRGAFGGVKALPQRGSAKIKGSEISLAFAPCARNFPEPRK